MQKKIIALRPSGPGLALAIDDHPTATDTSTSTTFASSCTLASGAA